ncbi:MAG: right-handed parallel beta-helix repeat-containing protein [Dehalococcoidia bacterium]
MTPQLGQRRSLWLLSGLLGAVLALMTAAAFAAPATLVVDDDRVQCPDATFTHIQDAVNAAPAGATILVCAGTYIEQVTIPAGKNDLTLRAKTHQVAIIQAPPVMLSPKAIVRVAGAQDVTIRAFTITGPGGGPCDSLEYGVRVDSGGSATIEQNHITKIADAPFSGCQNGIGVYIGRVFEATTGSATIAENLIDQYQKGGIVVSNTGSSADIHDNIVRGVGPTAVIAQNGIQVSSGATASLHENAVADNAYSPQSVVSTGILLFQPGQVRVLDNLVTKSDVAIYALGSTDTAIRDNRASLGAFDGIDLDGTTGARVSGNATTQLGFDGISLFDATTDSAISDNHSDQNRDDGYLLDSSAMKNTLSNNEAKGNTHFDCEDQSHGSGTAGTANTWKDNQGKTSSPSGICKAGDGDHGDDHGDDGHGHDSTQAGQAATRNAVSSIQPSHHQPQKADD